MSTLHACSPPPYTTTTTGTGTSANGPTGPAENAVISKKLWDFGKPVTYNFLDGTKDQMTAVRNAIAVWSTYANITFDFTSDSKSADIRISFAGPGSWSAVGTDAKAIDNTEPTMNLGWIAPVNPSVSDASTVLHEFGHAVGMMHELQSPARGGQIHLKELAVYNYYRPLLNNNDMLVKTQILDMYDLSTVSNFSQLDLNSIMMYFMPASLNEEGIDIPVNLVLSDLDKAYITLNYPRKTTADGGMSVTQALNIAGVPNDVSATILASVDQEKYEDARSAFASYNTSVMQLNAVNKSFLDSTTMTASADSGAQFGIMETVANVFDEPLFQAAVKNIVYQVFVQRGIPTVTSIPGSAQRDVLDTISGLIMNPAFAKTIHDFNTGFAGI